MIDNIVGDVRVAVFAEQDPEVPIFHRRHVRAFDDIVRNLNAGRGNPDRIMPALALAFDLQAANFGVIRVHEEVRGVA